MARVRIQAFIARRASFVFSLQTWLAESPEQSQKSGTPGYLSVGMACTYLPSKASDIDMVATGS